MDLRDREVELKLLVASPSAKALAGREVAGARPKLLESIYFDTKDGKLRSAGYSLRLRKDRGRWLQTVKSEEAGALDRFERERPVKSEAIDFSLLQATPVADIVDGEDELRPVFVTRVRRRSRVRTCADSRIEFSLDEGEIIAGAHSSPILELELELKAGRAADLFGEARRLVANDGLTPAFRSKSERGRLLVDGVAGQPAKFHAPRITADATAGAAFQAVGLACLRQLEANADLLVAGARLEALHQVRVALRRLRVALTLFKPIVADREAVAVKTELKWLTGEMGDARNLDVFIQESFAPAAEAARDRGAMARFGARLLTAQQRAYERAAAAVRSARFRALLVETARWIGDGEWTRAPTSAQNSAAPCGDFAPRALGRRRRAVKRRVTSLDWRDAVARHKLRIQIKKMRYACDFFFGLAAETRRRRRAQFAHTLENLQESLGRLNDIRVGERVAKLALTCGGHAGGDDADFGAGFVIGRTSAETTALIKQARRASRKFLQSETWW